jgi:hypothetical protein
MWQQDILHLIEDSFPLQLLDLFSLYCKFIEKQQLFSHQMHLPVLSHDLCEF